MNVLVNWQLKLFTNILNFVCVCIDFNANILQSSWKYCICNCVYISMYIYVCVFMLSCVLIYLCMFIIANLDTHYCSPFLSVCLYIDKCRCLYLCVGMCLFACIRYRSISVGRRKFQLLWGWLSEDYAWLKDKIYYIPLCRTQTQSYWYHIDTHTHTHIFIKIYRYIRVELTPLPKNPFGWKDEGNSNKQFAYILVWLCPWNWRRRMLECLDRVSFLPVNNRTNYNNISDWCCCCCCR